MLLVDHELGRDARFNFAFGDGVVGDTGAGAIRSCYVAKFDVAWRERTKCKRNCLAKMYRRKVRVGSDSYVDWLGVWVEGMRKGLQACPRIVKVFCIVILQLRQFWFNQNDSSARGGSLLHTSGLLANVEIVSIIDFRDFAAKNNKIDLFL